MVLRSQKGEEIGNIDSGSVLPLAYQHPLNERSVALAGGWPYSTYPAHFLTEAVYKGIHPKRLVQQIPPAQSARKRTLLLVQCQKQCGPGARLGTGSQQTKIPHRVAAAIRYLFRQDRHELVIGISHIHEPTIFCVFCQIFDHLIRNPQCVILTVAFSR